MHAQQALHVAVLGCIIKIGLHEAEALSSFEELDSVLLAESYASSMCGFSASPGLTAVAAGS